MKKKKLNEISNHKNVTHGTLTDDIYTISETLHIYYPTLQIKKMFLI